MEHLPADQDYAIYTVVEEGPQKFVITTKKFKAYAEGDHWGISASSSRCKSRDASNCRPARCFPPTPRSRWAAVRRGT